MPEIFIPGSVLPDNPKVLEFPDGWPLSLDAMLRFGETDRFGGLRVSMSMKPAESLGGFSADTVRFERPTDSDQSFVSAAAYFKQVWKKNRFIPSELKGKGEFVPRLKKKDLVAFPGAKYYVNGPIAYFGARIAGILLAEPNRKTLWWWRAKRGITSVVFLGSLCSDPITFEMFFVRIRLIGNEWYAEKALLSGFLSGEDYIPFL